MRYVGLFLLKILAFINEKFHLNIEFELFLTCIIVGLTALVLLLILICLIKGHKYKKLRRQVLGNKVQVVTRKNKRVIMDKKTLQNPRKQPSVINTKEE